MKRSPVEAGEEGWPLVLFGPPQLTTAHGARLLAAERAHQLLCFVAVRSGQWVPREQAAALFWPDRPSAEARRNLRKVVFKARELAGEAGLEVQEHALRWLLPTDLAAIDELAGSSLCQLRRGALLEGLDDAGHPGWSDWLAAERARADERWRGAVFGRLRQALEASQRAAFARALLRLDALDEAAVGELVDAEQALDHAAEARRAFDDYAARLQATLGVEPSRALRDRVHAAPPPRLHAGSAPLAGAAAPTPTQAVVPSPPAGPASLAPGSPDGVDFVGRRTELSELGELLGAGSRLVTLLGPGGVGKSTLARRALPGLAHRAAAEPLWIELVDLPDAAGLPAHVAQRLGLQVAGDELERALVRAWAASPRLVVLDNAEHLTDLAPRLDAWLDAAPGLLLLVTSRVRLGARHERLLPLGGLAVPDEASRDLEVASRFDAVRLFVLRAAAAQADFSLERDLGPVIEIVEAVAGMPLAIELAASWTRLLPTAEIARDLHGSIDLLERDPGAGRPAARADHVSMRAVLDRAWALLAPREREALAALSVFRGGCVAAAARAVAGVSMPILSSLVDKSLLGLGEEGRFDLHPLVGAYAAERLAATPGAAAPLELRHAEHLARELEALVPHATGDVRRLLRALDPELPNAQAAWRRALAAGRADLAARMVRTLWAWFENRGRQREGIALLEPGFALPPQGSAGRLLHARLHHGLSMLHHRAGDNVRALAVAESGITVAADCGDVEAAIGCVLNTGMCHYEMGAPEKARSLFERGVDMALQGGSPQCLAWARGNLGAALMDLGRREEADQQLRTALAGSRAVGDHYNTAVHQINLGVLLRDRSDLAGSRAMLEEARRYCTAHGLEMLGLYALNNLGHVARQAGDLEASASAYEDVLARSVRAGLQGMEWTTLASLAQLALAQGDADSARRRLREFVRPAHDAGATVMLAVAASIEGDCRRAAGDPTAAAAAWAAALGADRLPAVHRQRITAKLSALPPEVRPAGTPSLQAVLAELLN